MADRKARSFQLKVPPGTRLGDIKNEIEQQIEDNYITVFQEIGAHEYLIELARATHVDELIEHGFDVEDFHFRCHPPHGYYLNVSVMGLKAFISDEEVITKLSTYGEIKGDVIRLKYKQDHELAGVENGNRLIRMVLTAQSIPYSLQIGGEWCRIIHNNQQLICSNCHEPGHSRKNCPSIECRTCKSLGHISYHCPTRNTRHTETTDENTTMPHDNTENDNTENEENTNNPTNAMEETGEPNDEETTMDDAEEYRQPMENTNTKWTVVSAKRPHQTDSNSDPVALPRKQRHKPRPNLSAARHVRKNPDHTDKS